MELAQTRRGREAGFSIIELIIAMAVTLLVMCLASVLLAQSLGVRSREHTRLEAVADAQRALNMMTRELANAGFGLNVNGIVAADSNVGQIRVRANLNGFGGAGAQNATSDADEDVLFAIINNGDERLIYRHDLNAGLPTPVADRVDLLQIEYLNSANAAVAPSAATKLRITIGVTLPAVGSMNSPGYQPPSRTQVVGDVALRNNNLDNF